MLKHIIDAAYQLASDNGLNEVCEFIAAVPVNDFKEVFHGAKTPEDVIAIAQEEMKEDEKGHAPDLMYKVMMDDKDAIETLKLITCAAEKLATKCAECGLDIYTMCGLMATMIDKYQAITKIPHDVIYDAWDFAKNARDFVNAVCGDPLDQD